MGLSGLTVGMGMAMLCGFGDFSWDITSNICGFNKQTWLYNGCGIICHMRFSVLMELNGDIMRIQDETSWDQPIYGI